MKVYKVVLRVIDFDELGGDEIANVLKNNRYPNHCMSPDVVEIDSRDIGEWSDDHPLNFTTTCDAEFARLFEDVK